MKKIKNTLPLNLIQNIRIIQSLSEVGFKVVVEDNDLLKFNELNKIFDLNIVGQTDSNSLEDDVINLDEVYVSHSEPSVTICSVKKTLVFPREFLLYFKAKWGNERDKEVTFSGLVTYKRKLSIVSWLLKNNISIDKFKLFYLEMTQYLPSRLRVGGLRSITLSFGPLTLINSINGRVFPKKSLDHVYYDDMLNSKFVLCPDGDFVWTYRFFESIICGAIPIVENDCAAYKGFRYRKMSDPINELEWSEEDALYNFQLCMDRICLNDEEVEQVFKLIG